MQPEVQAVSGSYVTAGPCWTYSRPSRNQAGSTGADAVQAVMMHQGGALTNHTLNQQRLKLQDACFILQQPGHTMRTQHCQSVDIQS